MLYSQHTSGGLKFFDSGAFWCPGCGGKIDGAPERCPCCIANLSAGARCKSCGYTGSIDSFIDRFCPRCQGDERVRDRRSGQFASFRVAAAALILCVSTPFALQWLAQRAPFAWAGIRVNNAAGAIGISGVAMFLVIAFYMAIAGHNARHASRTVCSEDWVGWGAVALVGTHLLTSAWLLWGLPVPWTAKLVVVLLQLLLDAIGFGVGLVAGGFT